MTWRDLVGEMDDTLVEAFGVATTYIPATGTVGATSVRGIFDAAYVRVDAGQVGVESAGPMVFYRTVDLPLDPDSDDPEIVIEGVSYGVRERQRDGQGGIRMFLQRL